VITMDIIEQKQKLGANLSGRDPEAQFATVMYFAYKTISSNTRMTVRKLKALLCVEYLIKEDVLDGVLSSLVSRSMFACVKRWRDPERPIDEMSLSIVSPAPTDFSEWLIRTEGKYPELSMFEPPIYCHKD
jgi:hypothetical protein